MQVHVAFFFYDMKYQYKKNFKWVYRVTLSYQCMCTWVQLYITMYRYHKDNTKLLPLIHPPRYYDSCVRLGDAGWSSQWGRQPPQAFLMSSPGVTSITRPTAVTTIMATVIQMSTTLTMSLVNSGQWVLQRTVSMLILVVTWGRTASVCWSRFKSLHH